MPFVSRSIANLLIMNYCWNKGPVPIMMYCVLGVFSLDRLGLVQIGMKTVLAKE